MPSGFYWRCTCLNFKKMAKKRFWKIVNVSGIVASLAVLKVKAVLLILAWISSLFIAKASLEEIIDDIFPYSMARLVFGMAGILFFGYLLFFKKD